MITFDPNGYNINELKALHDFILNGYNALDCYYGCYKCPHRVLCTDLSKLVKFLEQLTEERE